MTPSNCAAAFCSPGPGKSKPVSHVTGVRAGASYKEAPALYLASFAFDKENGLTNLAGCLEALENSLRGGSLELPPCSLLICLGCMGG